MRLLSCDKCGRIITNKEKLLEIVTEVTKYKFCKVCIREAYNSLIHKKMKSADETNLLANFRKYLKENKLLAES